MKSKNANRRKLRNLIVFRSGQFRLAFTNLFYLVLIALVIVLAVLSPLYFGMSDAQDPWDVYVSAKLFRLVLERTGLGLLVISVIAFTHSILLSHKIFGPLVNIRHTVNRIAEGDFTRAIHLRSGDYLQDDARRLNEMMIKLSDKIERIADANEQLVRAVDAQVGPSEPHRDADQGMRRIKEATEHCRSALGQFKFTPTPN
jgi:methyl-accepting chemotaxis protein